MAITKSDAKEQEKTKCPICLEPAPFMVAPRVTKCGHIFCYSCILHYLAYDNERRWKKCPLCAESIYKKDLRKVSIHDYGNTIDSDGWIEMELVCRSKSNINVKRKEGEDGIVLESLFPDVKDVEYGKSRISICNEEYIR